MSSIEAIYCSQGDMQFVIPSIDEYDMKRVQITINPYSQLVGNDD